MIGRKKLKENRVWSANKREVICKKYKFSNNFT